MIYILTIILMLQSEGSQPTQHVITTQWTSHGDCQDEEGLQATSAENDPSIMGWWIDPHSCEAVAVPSKG